MTSLEQVVSAVLCAIEPEESGFYGIVSFHFQNGLLTHVRQEQTFNPEQLTKGRQKKTFNVHDKRR